MEEGTNRADAVDVNADVDADIDVDVDEETKLRPGLQD
jgi:hypothetical protein